MKKSAAGIGAVVVLALAPSAAVAAQPADPGCYGQFVSNGAHTSGGNGEFASGTATSPAFKGSGNMTIGQDGVPLLKALSCGP